MTSLSSYIDHTYLKTDATEAQISKLCEEAKLYSFFGVCVRPEWITFAKRNLKNSSVQVVTVVAFHEGNQTLEQKIKETKEVLSLGTDEIDFVLNRQYLKQRQLDLAFQEFNEIRKLTLPKTIKVILETSELTKEEIVMACTIAKLTQIDFVKTSTGFTSGGATLEDVTLMKNVVGPKTGVKASGGIRDQKTALAMIQAGASRLGTSNGVQIVQNQTSTTSY